MRLFANQYKKALHIHQVYFYMRRQMRSYVCIYTYIDRSIDLLFLHASFAPAIREIFVSYFIKVRRRRRLRLARISSKDAGGARGREYEIRSTPRPATTHPGFPARQDNQ